MTHPSVEMMTPMVAADPATADSCVADDDGYPGMTTGVTPEGTGNPRAAVTADPPTYTVSPDTLDRMTVQGPAGTLAMTVATVPTAHCDAWIATGQTAPALTVTRAGAAMTWLNVTVDPCANANVPLTVTVVPV